MSKKTKILLYSGVVLVLAILLALSSFAWFSLSRTPRVSNISIYVNSLTGMEISLSPDDSGEWGQNLKYIDMVSESSPLRPVTWSEKDGRFYSAVYGIDGRQLKFWNPLTDDMNANRDDHAGYYCVGTFYARTDENVSVSLSPAVATVDGTGGSGTFLVGTPVWDANGIMHTNGSAGAEKAVRVGIRVTRLDATGAPTEDKPLFYIYEPNADTHFSGAEGYVRTPSIDGGSDLVPEDRIIAQTTTYWRDADPVEKGKLIYSFGEFITPNHLFDMSAGEKVKIQLYVWLEGQDADCTNALKESKIMTNIQFSATSIPSSGME